VLRQQQPRALALLLFLLVLPVFTFFLGPLASARRASTSSRPTPSPPPDRCGHLVSALVKLYEDNASTLTPDPLYRRSTTRIRPQPADRRLLAHA
jgi:STE24 endopeptidase